MVKEVLENIEFENNKTHQGFEVEIPQVQIAETIEWDNDRSPFPGLRAFTEEDADIFFGRTREIDQLVQQVRENRFVAVVGASGSGKSSLVAAGLIPRLRENAITGSKDWKIVRFVPGDDPFINMVDAVIRELPSISLSQFMKAKQDAVKVISQALLNYPDWVKLLLYIDQLEELFTLNTEKSIQSFTNVLASLTESDRLRIVVTMRHDFYHKAIENPRLAELLRNRAFPLSIPKRESLRQMVEMPAIYAGIEFENGVVEKMLDDTGDEPGNLALLAYTLDEIYQVNRGKLLSLEDYFAVGGVKGAIGDRAERLWNQLEISDEILEPVFYK